MTWQVWDIALFWGFKNPFFKTQASLQNYMYTECMGEVAHALLTELLITNLSNHTCTFPEVRSIQAKEHFST